MIGRAAAVAVLLALVVAPFVPMGGMRQYVLHVVIQIFIWSFIGGAWSLMGRFGLVSLGLTLKTAGAGGSLLAAQSADKRVFYYAALIVWLIGLWVWVRLDRSMARAAMEAIGEDEVAAASVGVHVARFKLAITALSAALTAFGGVVYAQYITYVNPETLAGIGVSLRIVFAVVLGGMYSWLGPTVGTALTITLQEYLRVKFGLRLIGMAETIYGLLLVVFIIFLPAGIYGSVRALLARRRAPAPATA